MKLTTLMVTAVLSLMLCGTLSAKPLTGVEMLDICKHLTTGNSDFNAGICGGFIDGALNTLTVWEESDVSAARSHDKKAHFCVPDVTNEQPVLVFVKYLEDRPERLHESAVLLFVEAMRQAFPCRSS